MNDITKEKIVDAVGKAIKDEHLMNREASDYFGISVFYISYLKTQMYWKNIPEKAWGILHTWMQSGITIKEFGRVREKYLKDSCGISPETTTPTSAPGPATVQGTDASDGIMTTIMNGKTVEYHKSNIPKVKDKGKKPPAKKNPPEITAESTVTVKGKDKVSDDILSKIGLEIEVIVKLKK